MSNLEQRIKLTYQARADLVKNPVSSRLLKLIGEKETNLCLAVDEPEAELVLELADKVGPEICVLKTHIDIIEEFKPSIIEQLKSLSQKHQFFIFEDRKFADIGNTVKMQYEKGVYKIVEWSDLTNAHIVPGPGIIEGLQEVAKEKGLARGLILLAQMSSKGNLATDDYTKAAIKMAEEYSDFVVGFIGNGGQVEELKKLSDLADPKFIIMTPGVKLGGGGDALKQQYTTPADVIKAGSDIIIVGRGIYGEANPAEAAKEYREAGWKAYKERLK
ncbi:MAG: orotidine-5'-phosphate decarboxylase [Candidatus Kerfeldbacteria bacterium CG_4_10_14_0_8_um_filter_42_10]|uniref:Orotidine 5'-phosphate decarboxylase n=1 Tax=Candidatus Kerfeldbacteria bacterium CG_4_10_14_0_8_um_filter_42_10 TaxID=2014248 RepID=A0A2M7RFM9_9BACT|nr:MAG: orotidine-5'-phosphate decarboxylase [Candidatus Kerfeldbacteria bacterium CG_4_10_14_0_8_um_filter_42_10]